MKILVTGAAGFIGSHVAQAYLDQGHEVVVVDNLSTGYQHNVDKRAKFYNIDIRDPQLCEVFANEQPDVVNHHAAQISVPLSIEDPRLDADINVLGFINILDCCIKYKVKKLIYISSGGAIYGEAKEYPTTEEYHPQPLSVYAINKMSGEHYLQLYRHQYGLDYTVLRYSNVYGPRQVSHGEAGVVSIFIEKLLQGLIPTVYAYPDEPAGMIRDYVYVADVVRANVLALTGGHNDYFNIGTCIETTTMQLYNAIQWQLGLDVPPHRGEARKGDLRRSMLDVSKAFKVLGWSPIYTLEDGVKETIAYFKQKQVQP
ncbi:MAG: NAD-dependent epimerase/dehydratase family protein [Candidatus Cloacimonetes bacterium]|nr:NAD-dependent epimerase/dehydratase family protein [Candidatus Cloacimonadota bacterium]